MFHVIMNPASSTGNGARVWNTVEAVLKEKNIEYKLYETTGPDSAKRYASDITCDEENDILIGIGGDGTMNEIFCGINDFSKVTLGYIPSGSGGDLARDLKISLDPIKALETILKPKEYKYMDVGHIVTAECDKKFGVSAGIGFDAAVCHEALHSKLKLFLNKLHIGKLTYVLIALKQLAGAKKTGCTVILDDARKIHLEHFHFVTVMIHRYEGGGFKFCPAAKCDDGLMDICVVGNINKTSFLRILPTAYSGKHLKYKGIDTYTAKKVQVVCDKPLAIHADGEYAGVQKELTATLCSKRVRMIVR